MTRSFEPCVPPCAATPSGRSTRRPRVAASRNSSVRVSAIWPMTASPPVGSSSTPTRVLRDHEADPTTASTVNSATGDHWGPDRTSHYDDVTRANLRAVLSLVARGDVVVVHDPQPLGLVPGLVAAGATVVCTCHVGIDMPNAIARSAWDFLRDDVLRRPCGHLHPACLCLAWARPRPRPRDPAVHRRCVPQERRARSRACRVDRPVGGLAGPSSSWFGVVPPRRRLARHDRGAGRGHRDAPDASRRPARGSGVAMGCPEGPDRRHARVRGRPVTRRGPPDAGGTPAGIGGRRSRGGCGARRGPRSLEALADGIGAGSTSPTCPPTMWRPTR